MLQHACNKQCEVRLASMNYSLNPEPHVSTTCHDLFVCSAPRQPSGRAMTFIIIMWTHQQFNTTCPSHMLRTWLSKVYKCRALHVGHHTAVESLHTKVFAFGSTDVILKPQGMAPCSTALQQGTCCFVREAAHACLATIG